MYAFCQNGVPQKIDSVVAWDGTTNPEMMWLPVVDVYPEVTQWQRATKKPYVEWEIVGSEVHTTYTVEDMTDEEINAVLESGNTELELRAIKAVVAPMIADVADADIDDYAGLVPPWIVGEDVVQGNKRQYGGYVYKCGQGHKTQVDWTPDVAISLWSRAAEVDPGTGYEVWKAWDGHNESLYQVGDIVWYPSIDTQLYISTAGNNHWEPGVFGWTVYNP
jgi:hypothetical protein